jgi:WD40 repeat protein
MPARLRLKCLILSNDAPPTWVAGPEAVVLEHHSAVRSASFNPDGTVIVTASDAGIAQVWNLTGAKPTSVALIGHQHGVSVAAFSPDGLWIATGSDDGTARLCPYFPDTRNLIRKVKRSLRRCLTQSQRAQYDLPSAPIISTIAPAWLRLTMLAAALATVRPAVDSKSRT